MTTPSRPEPGDTLPSGLASPLEKLVYLYVRERDGATVYDLRDALDVPQLRLYPTLATLAKRGLVERQGDAVWLPDRGPSAAGGRRRARAVAQGR